MDWFVNVSVFKQANVYYDGNVTSRTVMFANGEKKTLGVMLPGEYEFSTDDREVMEIITGTLEVRLPDSEGWLYLTGGQSFEVPAHAKFSLRVHELTDYCCSFLK